MSYAKQAVTRLTLDMGLPDVQKSVSVTAGDTNRRLEVTLIDRGAPFALPPNWTAVLAGVLPSGEELYGSCVVDDGRIVFDFVATDAVTSEEGVFAVAFDIFDEGAELVASPKFWMHVVPSARRLKSPAAENALTALKEFVGAIGLVHEELDMLTSLMTSTGTFTIHASDWKDSTPTQANVSITGVENGSVVLLLPADENTRTVASEAKLSAYPTMYVPINGQSAVHIFRADAEMIPGEDMTFAYVVIKTAESDRNPLAAIVGVDAYGGGTGTGGGTGGVDQAIINQVLMAAEAARESAENAGESAENARESAETALNAAESAQTAQAAAEDAAARAEAAADRAESAGGSGGESTGGLGYTGRFVLDWKPDSRYGLGNTNGDYYSTGAQIDVYPADRRTYQIATEIGAYILLVADHTSNDVIIFGLDDDAELPNETMTFNFRVTETGTDDPPSATLFLEWNGSAGGGVDQSVIDDLTARINTVDEAVNDIADGVINLEGRFNTFGNNYENFLGRYADEKEALEDSITEVEKAVPTHNVSTEAHSDIRLLIQEHREEVNALLDSDDETLDQLSEIVAYIKSNKALIDAITTSKVSVSDIVNNLTSDVTNKPLSAAQGVALKGLIDSIDVSGGIYVGSGTPPTGATVWIDPAGTAYALYNGEVETV